MNPFSDFPHSDLDVVAPDGTVRSTASGIVSAKQITVFDDQLVIMTGDEMRRQLPNGTDETFEVLDPQFNEAFHSIPAHFNIVVRKKGTFPHGQGGNYTISVTGANSRVNFGSHDHSTNIAFDSGVFTDLKRALNENVTNKQDRDALLGSVSRMEKAKDKGELASAYQNFIGAAADHIGVITPFLPALGQLFGG